MSSLLYIKASPRGPRSHSLAVAEAFLEEYLTLHPQDALITQDLFAMDLPPFDGLRLNAKYNILHGEPHNTAEQAAWQEVEALIRVFKGADKYVLATPMWNFSIPYRLKQYLDLIVQPTLTFGYSAEQGYFGLVTGKPLFIAAARGGQYPPGTPAAAADFQVPYLEFIFRFMGFTDIRVIKVEPTLEGGPEVAKAQREAAMAQARELARSF